MASQLITPNPQIACTPGLCLVYVRETYGIGPKYSSAIAGWNASMHRHTDQNFPENAWVPIWFTLSDNEHGHVALRQPDGSVWSSSSPTGTTPVHHPSLSDLLTYYGGRLTYLGWTEDIEGVFVVDVSSGAINMRPGTNRLVVTHALPLPVAGVMRRVNKGVQAMGIAADADEARDAESPRPKRSQVGRMFPHRDE